MNLIPAGMNGASMTGPCFSQFRETIRSEGIAARALDSLRAAKVSTGVFVSLCAEERIRDAVRVIEARQARGETLPLAGLPFAVKDNLDVAGMPSTSNCPGYGRVADVNAPAVDKAIDAGAILIGKNTMDQFATGLNGTRAPAPLCRNVFDPDIIPGGSSSGSAVAVASGICAFALGSDTGGSGRVPAAANGIVGLKPTPGLVSGRGMVYCNRSFDVIPIFAATVDDANAVFEAIRGPDPLDPFAFTGAVLSADLSASPRLAVPCRKDLTFFSDVAAERTHAANMEGFLQAGFTIEEIDFGPFREAGRLVFESALVAERLVDYGDFIEAHPDAVIASVRTAIDAGRAYSAREAFEALYALADLRVVVRDIMKPFAALVVPTIPRLYTVEELMADPMAKNTVMGTYTYFANPLGLCAIAVPGRPREDRLPSSVCFVGQGGHDENIIKLARTFERVNPVM